MSNVPAVKQINTAKSGHLKEILLIGIPSILEFLFTAFASIIDSQMVSSLGVGAISAVSVTNQPRLFILCGFFALFTVSASLTAKYVGKKDRTSVNRILLSSLLCVVAAGLVISVLCVALAEPIMKVCSNQPDTMAASILYFRIIMGGLIVNALYLAINAVMRGCGKTMITLISNIIFCVVNIFFNYLLIGGHWGFPAWGIGGAAIATVLGTIAAMIFCFASIWKKSFYVSLLFCINEKIWVNVSCFKEIYHMWKKVAVENLLSRVGFLISGIIVARAGSLSTAVYAVGMHLLNITFAFGSGLQSAAVALVARSLGAGKYDDIRAYSKQILKLGVGLSLALSLVIILISKYYYGLVGSDPQFITSGVISCFIIAVISPIQVCQIIYNGILKGIGDVKYTMIASIIAVTLVNTTVTFITTMLLGMGIWGIWSGIIVSQTVWLCLLCSRFKKIKFKED